MKCINIHIYIYIYIYIYIDVFVLLIFLIHVQIKTRTEPWCMANRQINSARTGWIQSWKILPGNVSKGWSQQGKVATQKRTSTKAKQKNNHKQHIERTLTNTQNTHITTETYRYITSWHVLIYIYIYIYMCCFFWFFNTC